MTVVTHFNNNRTPSLTNIALDDGLDFVLSHLEEPIWPRTVSSFTTEERQILVYNKEEALARFRQANLLDCRINAYPYYVGITGINRQPPNFIFIDLDLCHFNSRKSLDKALRKVLKNIRKKLDGAQANAPGRLTAYKSVLLYRLTKIVSFSPDERVLKRKSCLFSATHVFWIG